jgi:hypothetical protein
MIEGSGSRAGSGSGSIALTSGSGRPKNMWIRIRIRNTGINRAKHLDKYVYVGRKKLPKGKNKTAKYEKSISGEKRFL